MLGSRSERRVGLFFQTKLINREVSFDVGILISPNSKSVKWH